MAFTVVLPYLRHLCKSIFLCSDSSSFSLALVSPLLMSHPTEHGITSIKSTRRNCRGGRRKRGNSVSCPGTARQFRANISPTLNEDDLMGCDRNAQNHESSNLHNRLSSLLNIQGNTFQASKTKNLPVLPVSPENGRITSRLPSGNSRTDDNTFPVIPDSPIACLV